MFKLVKFIQTILFSAVFISLFLLIYGFLTVPDEIYTVTDENVNVNSIYKLIISEEQSNNLLKADKEKYKVKVSLFNAIPIKNSQMTVSRRQYVVAGGTIFGLRLYTDGVVIVSTDKVDTANGMISPAENAGLLKGDIILSVNGEKICSHSQLVQIFSDSCGNPLTVIFERNGTQHQTVFSAVFSVAQRKYMAGLWIRDSAAGIGTMTFYDKTSGAFAGLGHAVCDVDTGEILPLYNGDIVNAAINGCYKGSSGEAGELCGSFTSDRIGSLLYNNKDGVYGFLDNKNYTGNEIPIAMKNEVKTGKAQIISTIDNSGPKSFDIEIEKVSIDDSSYKNLIIKVTDKALIEKTGGIVQGMSGSPIIQNGMLVGAVTHVFVNDPQRGFGIFAEYMIERAKLIAQNTLTLAS